MEPLTHLPAATTFPTASPIHDAFLSAFADGTLALDCPKMTLRQLAETSPRQFTGRGMLLLREGEFQLRMYADDDGRAPGDGWHDLVRIMQWTPGEEIPIDEYFALTTIDLSGTEWTCAKVQVKFHGGGDHGLVLTGQLFDGLKHQATLSVATTAGQLRMFFYEDLKVPFGHLVSTTTKVGDQTIATAMEARLARFDAGDLNFQIEKTTKEKGSTVLRVLSSQARLPEGIETRVEESLRYVTLSPVRWRIVEKISEATRSIEIVPIQRANLQSPLDEPLDHQRSDCIADFWDLFRRYFRYVSAHGSPRDYHPLSTNLFHVTAGGIRQLDVLALIVSIAVEGVLESEHANLAEPSKAVKDAIDYVSKLLARLKCEEPSLKPRLKGMLGQMKSSRAKDKLKALREAGEITQGMERTWGRLRNSMAHPQVNIDPDKIHALWVDCLTIYTLLNLVVFKAIGYTGQYQDFSKKGWPILPLLPAPR